MYQILADLVLLLHTLFVAFVVTGLLLILLGGLRRWAWVRRRWFRLTHLGAIVVVVVQSWLGLICPLTTLEMWLRQQAGQHYYEGGFIQHWLQTLIYYNAPGWVFAVIYTLFGLLVVASWRWFPPEKNELRRVQ